MPGNRPRRAPTAAFRLSTAQDTLDALLGLQPLERLPRTGWILAGVREPETIGAHVLGTAQVALALLPRIAPPLDATRALAMALVHDAPEARSGDLPRAAAARLPPGAKAVMEEAIAGELLADLGPLAVAAWREYAARATREARFVRVCDGLQLGVRLVGYLRAGAGGLGEFRGTLEELDATEFPAAEELRRAILERLP